VVAAVHPEKNAAFANGEKKLEVAKVDAPRIDEDDDPAPAPSTVRRRYADLKLDPQPLGPFEESIRPGQLIKLDNSEITFQCLDVKQMYNRLEVVLVSNACVPSKVESKSDGSDSGTMRVIEISATADQLRQVLAALKTAEDNDRLLAKVDVKAPAPLVSVEQPKPAVPPLDEKTTAHGIVRSPSGGPSKIIAARPSTEGPPQTELAAPGRQASPPPDRFRLLIVLREPLASAGR
jgi:hypothetical protein